MIASRGLKKVFRHEDVEATALDHVDFHAGKGDFIAVMGPSGCGKTTLLNILGLLDQPDEGEYFIDGLNMTLLDEKQRSGIRKEKIGFIFQNFNLIDELTVFENVELPLIYKGVSAKTRKIRVFETLDKMGIPARKNYFPLQLSGGQQQRVAIARAIIGNPPLLLADEPTGALDSARGDEVMNILSKLNDNGTTIVMVTHSQRDAEYSNRIVYLFDGKLRAERK
jgi:putative ABC transport system ATP-binding protein